MPGATGEANSNEWDYAIGCTMNGKQYALGVKANGNKSGGHDRVALLEAPQELAAAPLWRLEKDVATGGQLYRLSLGGRYLSMANDGAGTIAVVTDARSEAVLLFTKQEDGAWLLIGAPKMLVLTVRGTDVTFDVLAARTDWRSVNTKQVRSLIQAFHIVSKTNEAWPPKAGKAGIGPQTPLRLATGVDSGLGRKFAITCQMNQKYYAIGLEKGGDTTRGHVGLVATELADGASPLKAPAWKFIANDIEEGGGYHLSIDGLYLAMMPTGRNTPAVATPERERAAIFHPAKDGGAWLLKTANSPFILTIHGTEVCFQVPVSPSLRQPFNTPERGLVALIQTFYIAGKGVWPPAAGEEGTNRRGGIQVELCIESNGKEYFLGSEEDELIISDRHQYWNVVPDDHDPFVSHFRIMRNGYSFGVHATPDGRSQICLTRYASDSLPCYLIRDDYTFSVYFEGKGRLVVDIDKMAAYLTNDPDEATSFLRHWYYWLRFPANGKVLDADPKNGIAMAMQRVDRPEQIWRFDNGALQSVVDGRYLNVTIANDLAWLDLSEERIQLLFSPEAIHPWDRRDLAIVGDTPRLAKSKSPTPNSQWTLIPWYAHPVFENQLVGVQGKFVLCNVATGLVLTVLDDGSGIGGRPLTFPAASASLWTHDQQRATLWNDAFGVFLDSADDKVAVRPTRNNNYHRTDYWGLSKDGYLIRRDGNLKVVAISHTGLEIQDYATMRDKRQRWHVIPENAIAQHAHTGNNDERR